MKRATPGFTLIEMLLAMCLFSAILTVVAVALGGLARADRRSRDQLDSQRNIQQFVMRLRQDLHEAGGCTIAPAENPPTDGGAKAESASPPRTLTLSRGDGRIVRFEATDRGIVRTVTLEGAVRHRESYAWGGRADVAWTMDTSHELPMAVLTLTIAGRPDRPAQRHVVRTTLLNYQPETVE